MSKRGDARVAELVALARAAVAEKLHGQPDPAPVWLYRTVVRVVISEIRRDEK